MTIEIVEQSVDLLRAYGAIPMSFTVDSQYRVEPIDRGLGGWTLTEERVEPPYVKDYDDVEDERPVRWSKRWNLSNWVVLAAVDRGAYGSGAPSLPGTRREPICWRDAPTWPFSGTYASILTGVGRA